MPDNIEITPGAGAVVAADNVDGVLFQRVKVTFGDEGAALDVSQTNRLPVKLDDAAETSLTNIRDAVAGLLGKEYETVDPGQTDQVLGAAGAAGDFLSGLLITPLGTSPGAVTIKDGIRPAITIFAGGTDSVATLIPFPAPLGMKSISGAWKVTTGANVSVVAVGDFS